MDCSTAPLLYRDSTPVVVRVWCARVKNQAYIPCTSTQPSRIYVWYVKGRTRYSYTFCFKTTLMLHMVRYAASA